MINNLANSGYAIISETVDRLRKDKSIEVDRNKVVYKNGKVVDYEKRGEVLGTSNVENVVKALADEAEYYSKSFKGIDTYEVAEILPIQSYQGKWYFKGRALNYEKQVRLVRHYNSTFELPQIQTTIKTADILKAVDEIPPFKIDNNLKKVDNGFRFNKTAYQLIHYYLFEDKQKYIMFLMSEGGKGKSTFTNFLRQLFKNEYYSADSGNTSQFSASYYAGNRLVCFSDCTSSYIENMHILKQISGNDEVSIERKGQQAYSGTIDAHLLFVGNEPLSYDILDSGNQQRFVNLPWENDFNGTPDPKWKSYIWTDEEIAFQIELAKNTEPCDFEYYRNQTIKESLKHRKEILYDSYVKYDEAEKVRKYSLENFLLFWQTVAKFYKYEEIKEIREIYANNKMKEICEFFNKDKLQEINEKEIEGIF